MGRTTHYTSEFREEAVKLALSSEHSTASIARELGINENTLYNWVGKAMKEKKISKKSTTGTTRSYQELEQENRQLKKDLKRVELEREILKKAAAYFASQEL